MSSSDRQTLDHFFRSPPGADTPDTFEDDAQPAFTARDGLAQLCLDEALSRRDYARLLTGGPLAVVAIVPSASWIGPIRDELQKRTHWGHVVAPTVRKKLSALDTDEGKACANVLSGGGRVLGVANAVANLPPALLASADLTITVRPPSDRALRRLIRWMTGQPARNLPVGAALGLDLDVICAAIREGSGAADCVRRLAAAARAVSVVDASLADVPHVRDLHGYGAVGDWARRLVSDVEKWRAAGSDPAAFAKLDRNVAIGGPPGTGKTTLARSVAKSAGLPLIVTSIGQLFSTTSGYLDAIIKGFDEAVSRAVACNGVLLIDEIDSLPSRANLSGSRNKDYWGPLISQVLTTLDGAVSGSAGRIIVIGCTNHLDALDPALVRPGRLRPMELGLPSRAELVGIFRQHLGSDLSGVDLTMVARLAEGATGAEVADKVASARRDAADAGRPMDLADLMAVVAPPDDRPIEAILTAAYHEAAHSLNIELSGAGRVRTVTVLSDGHAGGRTDWVSSLPDMPTRADIERIVVTGLAGRAADEMFGGANTGAGGATESDLGVATKLIAGLHGSYGLGERLVMRAPYDSVADVLKWDPGFTKTVDDHLKELLGRAREFVRKHRDLIVVLAHRLVEERVIDGAELRRIIVTASTPAPRTGGRRHAH